jgi:hypothetical protein
VEADEDDDDIDPEVQWGQRLEPLPESETNLPIVPALPFVDELNRQSAESRAEEILKSLDTPDGCRVPTVEEQFELDKATLKAHADSATARYNREGVTPNQARALVRNPFLIFKFRGERIDAFWRQLVEQDLDLLLRWELTPRGQTGPDILHLTLPGVWGDATTPDAFEKHVNEYFYSHGESGFLIYVAPLRF